MMITRISKILMCLSLASFAFLATFNNITDYNSNYAFVQHVLSMDTTFPDNALMYRAINSEKIWTAGYWLIIAGEGLTAFLFLIATFSLFRARHETAIRFNQAKGWTHAAAVLGFLVWYFGFIVVGGEWFAMWQSPSWNGQEAAFKFYMTILAVLIFVNQPDSELG